MVASNVQHGWRASVCSVRGVRAVCAAYAACAVRVACGQCVRRAQRVPCARRADSVRGVRSVRSVCSVRSVRSVRGVRCNVLCPVLVSKFPRKLSRSKTGESKRLILGLLNGEDLVLSTGKEVLLVVDHSLNVLQGVVILNFEGRGLTVVFLRKICIPLRGWSVE